MVDEFVYQFQSFQQYRGKLSQKSAEELAALRECSQVSCSLAVKFSDYEMWPAFSPDCHACLHLCLSPVRDASQSLSQVWDIGTVLNYLQAFVDKSGIIAELTTPGA